MPLILGWMITDLRAAREAHGLTLRRAAGMVGVDPAHLSRIERHLTFPSLVLLADLAEMIDLPLHLAVSSFDPSFRRHLCKARQAASLSEMQLADLLDTDSETLTRIESGRIPVPLALRTKARLILGMTQ